MIAMCAVVRVHLCIPQKYLHTADLSGIFVRHEAPDPSEVQRLGVEIDVYASDNFQYFGTAGANRACEEDRCVYYRKHCDPEGKVCEYEGGFEKAGARWADTEWGMKITAKSSSALRRAESALSLNLSDSSSKSGVFVPLSAVWIESPSMNFGYCKPGVRVQGCMTREEWRQIVRHGHD